MYIYTNCIEIPGAPPDLIGECRVSSNYTSDDCTRKEQVQPEKIRGSFLRLVVVPPSRLVKRGEL